MSPAQPSSPRRAAAPLLALLQVRRDEAPAVAWGALFGFCVLASWYVLRPIRDELGVAGGVDKLAWLFTGTLVAMLAVHPLFAALVARYPRRRFIPWTYRFFAANLVLFFAAWQLAPEAAQLWIGRLFFVWASLFNLFVVSVFWGLMVDLFDDEQGRRLFGLLAVGGTLGGIAGAAATASLVTWLGSAPLLLVAALLLEAAVQSLRALARRLPARAAATAGESRVIGGGALAGLAHVARSPYLLGLCLFVLLYTIGSTFLYFLQAEIVAREFAERAARTAFFARLDLAVNLLTLLLQLTLTGHLLSRLGVRATLAILPILSIAGFVALGLAPALAVFVLFQVGRRAGNFALARPARELLFVPLAAEDKYKAKNFIDTFVYRTGDQLGAWTQTGLAALGLGTAALAAAAAPLAGLWLALALWLGTRQARLVRERRALGAEPLATTAPAPLPV